MEIRFTNEARVALYADCFKGNFEAALTHLGPILLERADALGQTHANIAGREVWLMVFIFGDTAIIGKAREDQ